MKNNIFKKFCILALILCLISGHMTIFTSAEGEVSAPPVKVLEKYVDVAELRAYLFDAFKECTNDRIELSQFNIPLADEEKQALCDFIWRDMPESFHVDQLKFKNNGKIITAIIVESYRYAETKEQYAEMLSECEAKAAELLDGIKDNDKLGDAEKALLQRRYDRRPLYDIRRACTRRGCMRRVFTHVRLSFKTCRDREHKLFVAWS